ncbi:MAG: PSD1 domain-containing protein [Planctomycetales bacterium]|nr:PSD1 domain-containing protein [Planctomycetales bacterium]
MNRPFARFLLSALCLASLHHFLPAAENQDVRYARDIQPLLARRCFICHGPDMAEAGLRLDVAEQAMATLDSGSRAIVPRQPGRSELLGRVTSDDDSLRMPPEGPALTAAEVALLQRWIDSGAAYDTHWAYRRIRRPPLPAVQATDWLRNPIDQFVLARLESEGLSPAPVASASTLVKRLYYDLIGLPPTPAQVEAFVGDASPDAYERLLDRLLASPHFGERWGRHWLDKARYADSDGYEKDRPRPTAWRYRDWVIEAINSDQPYDRFSIAQLAGDLLPEPSGRQKLATAFHRQTLTNTEGGVDVEEFRVEATFDRTETTAAIWLGLTMNCARCHTHKYDQITHHEYYQLFAFFNDAREVDLDVPRSALPLVASAPLPPAPLQTIPAVQAEPRTTHVLARGDFLQPAEEVQGDVLSVIGEQHPLQPRNAGMAADRLDLARWLLDKNHPLTARVTVNQVWGHLLGSGLVATVNDFGVRGELPTHPLLLDWLAWEFPRGMRWSRKQLIRTIAMSATYRQSSAHRPELFSRDPTNRLLARQNRWRVEAEVIRDLHLAAGGLLSGKLGGPSVFPPLPAGVAELSYANNFKWATSVGADRYRRGMYTFFKRTSPHPTLINFDCPDSNTTRLQRETSNTPLQALATLNNEVFTEAAQGLAQHILGRADEDDGQRLAVALQRCIARPPRDEEVERFGQLLTAAREYYSTHGAQAEALTTRHRVKTVSTAENAAWVATLRIVLNLDEFIVRE